MSNGINSIRPHTFFGLWSGSLLLILLFGLFVFVVFRHLSYPLLWNDEAETAMFATRVLEFGYPKVHDGKNVVNIAPLGHIEYGVQKRFDAYIVSGWAQYYWGAIGVAMANSVTNLYQKTFLMRLPFTLAGVLGLVLFGLLPVLVFRGDYRRLLLALFLYIVQLPLSVPLILHLRQARYYPLIILAVAIPVVLFIAHTLLNRLSSRCYNVALIVSLLFLFTVYHPAYFAAVVAMLVFLCVNYFFNESRIILSGVGREQHIQIIPPGIAGWMVFSRTLFPYAISVITILPLVFFFRLPLLTRDMDQYMQGLTGYISNVQHMVGFFWNNGSLPLAIFLQITVLIIAFRFQSRKGKLSPVLVVSNFLSVFFLLYIFVIARNPWFIFQRYFIVLQPILNIVVALDLVALVVWITAFAPFRVEISHGRYRYISASTAMITLFLTTFLITSPGIWSNIAGLRQYYDELRWQYRGPLDYVIPYLQERYSSPEDIIIGTNYEEPAYMLYLKSKVIIGYALNNMPDDLNYTPDVIIIRRTWAAERPVNANFLSEYLKRESYEAFSFLIADYPVNNIPESHLWFNHLYRTPIVMDPNHQLIIYVRQR